jgi:uncharacterized protein YjiS (DUF1127 family)
MRRIDMSNAHGYVLDRTANGPNLTIQSFLAALAQSAARGIEQLLVWQDRARQRRHLAELGDHSLKDLGLSRADVAGESSKPFWRT